MPGVRGIYKVVSRESYRRTSAVLVKLESTQVSSEVFAGRMELMITDPVASMEFLLDAEVVVEALPHRSQDIAAASLRR